MSQENVEIVESRLDLWNRGELEDLAVNPDAEWDFTNYEGWPEKPVLRGEEIRHFLQDWRTTFADYIYGVDRIVAVDERVLALCWQQGRGGGSTQAVRMEFAQIFTVRDGEVIRTENYSDRCKALEAVGLSE